jgi:hypothetical protein
LNDEQRGRALRLCGLMKSDDALNAMEDRVYRRDTRQSEALAAFFDLLRVVAAMSEAEREAWLRDALLNLRNKNILGRD